MVKFAQRHGNCSSKQFFGWMHAFTFPQIRNAKCGDLSFLPHNISQIQFSSQSRNWSNDKYLNKGKYVLRQRRFSNRLGRRKSELVKDWIKNNYFVGKKKYRVRLRLFDFELFIIIFLWGWGRALAAHA